MCTTSALEWHVGPPRGGHPHHRVEELEQELRAVEIDDEEFEYGKHFWLLHLCHDCGSPWCQKTHRTWYKATIFQDEDFYEHNDYLAGIAYFEEYNQDVESDTLAVA